MTGAVPTRHRPRHGRPRRLSASRVAIYLFLLISAAFFLVPLYVMIVTSLKDMSEIRAGDLFALPQALTVQPWILAWGSACQGITCDGMGPAFWNSVKITLPAVTASVLLGAVNGYALSFWRFRGAEFLFVVLLVGAFVPLQVFIYPLVRITSAVGLFGTLPGVILLHVCFSLPLMTLLFRNFYTTVPVDLFKAARIDGARFWSTFIYVMVPISVPMIVVALLIQITGTWNDFILGLIFAGNENRPMTVLLNNVVNSQFGEKQYNVNMAATFLTALVPLLLYFVSGRWFVRGITAGAVKG
jgi:glucose/mannose transport system permease protein